VQLVVREHERVPVQATRAAGERVLLPAEAQALLALCERMSTPAVVGGHHSLKFSRFCGVMQVGALTVEILPKVADDEGYDRAVLLRMVALAADLPLSSLPTEQLATQPHTLLPTLVRWYCLELSRQLQQGMLKAYVLQADDLPSIRGRWHPAQDALRQPGRPDRMHCEFDELSADNRFNQTLKAALRRAERWVRSHPTLRHTVQTLLAHLDEVQDRVVTVAELDALPLNRLTARYERALAMARWFLAHEAPDLRHGAAKGVALLFDMNALFQRTLAAALRRALPEGLRLLEEKPRRYLAQDHQGQARFQLRPDICLLRGTEVVAIVDAKWKRLHADQSHATWGVQQADVYQLHAYASTYQCATLALCYPRQHWHASAGTLPSFQLGACGTTARLVLAGLDVGEGSLTSGQWLERVSRSAGDVLGRMGLGAETSSVVANAALLAAAE